VQQETNQLSANILDNVEADNKKYVDSIKNRNDKVKQNNEIIEEAKKLNAIDTRDKLEAI
jgi:hypothetical protein